MEEGRGGRRREAVSVSRGDLDLDLELRKVFQEP